jgi:Rieske [2Fe-2S] domain
MKCLRRMPRYPVRTNFRKALEAAYVSATVIDKDGCRLCPHKGIPLHGLPTEKDGSVVCPGHGLRWTKDGKLVPRSAGESS